MNLIQNESTKKENKSRYVDYSLIIVILLLLGIGLVMVYSTSSYEASISPNINNAAYYLWKQAISVGIGLVIMIVFSRIPYRLYRRFSEIVYILALILVFLVLTPLGYSANGARRWLDLGISFQPAEAAKLAMIIYFADKVSRAGEKMRYARVYFILMGMSAPFVLAIWRITNNLSSAIIIFGICFIILTVACPKYKYSIWVILGGILLAGLYVALIVSGINMGFRGDRIRAWLSPESYASGIGFQTLQALYAIGSGGILGKGLGQSTQKMGFVPEAQNDMIFSIICEELGVFGGICIILLFLMLIWRLMVIATNASDLYGFLIIVGVIAHISIQVILNIAVVTNTIPNTGISLPFISYGGTSVTLLLLEMGIVLNIANSIEVYD